MKKILFLLVLMLIGITTQLTAQVNGTAARPLVSTADKPVYYYIENQSTTAGFTGNVLLSRATTGGKLRHALKTTLNNDSAMWQLVNESGTVKLKNKLTGYYMSGSHTCASAGDVFEVNKYEGLTYYKIRSGRQTPTLAHNNNLCDRQSPETDKLHWYFIVAPESDANYQELIATNPTSYFTEYGLYARTDNARKLNSLSFTAAQNSTLTINQQTVNNTSPVYFDKTTQVIEIVPGSNLSVSFNWTGGWMRNIAYVDWNNDKIFSTADATERIGYNALAGSGTEMTKSITYAVPAGQAQGDYRMRIMVDWFANHSSPNEGKFQLNYDGGAIVDVILRVTNTPAPPAPTLSFGTSNLIVKGDAFTLTPPAGATVKYTTDNTDPAVSATAVSGTSVTASGNFKLRAISVKDGVNSTELVRDIKTIDLTLGNEYYIVFQRTGNTVNPTLALKDMGDGVAMQTQTLQYGQTTQRWTVSKGTSDGLYKLTSIAGNIMYYNGSKFTVSASPAVDAEVDMRFITFSGTSGYTQYSGYEIQRKNSTTMGMNPIGGSAISKEIGEWDNGDGGNAINFMNTKGLLLTEIQKTQAIHDGAITGSDFGQSPASSKTDLQAAISSAQLEYEKSTSADDLPAITALQTAVINFNNIITNKSKLISSDATKYKWYSIRSNATNSDATYALGKVISSNGRILTEKFTFENPGTPVTDAQLFRFEISGSNIIIINKANGYYMDANGAISTSSTTFALNLLTDGYSFNIKPASANAIHAQADGLHIVNWAGNAGSASAWVFDYQKTTPKVPEFSGTGNWSDASNWTDNAKPNSYNDIVINGNVVMDESVTIPANNTLTVNTEKTLTVAPGKQLSVSGTFTNNGTIILQSNTSGTATVTGNVSGNATVEQYLPAATERTWWYLASPVTGAAWTVFGSNQVGEYSETSRSYSQPFAAAETLEAGRGYVVKMNASEAATYQFANKALNNGNISVALTRTVSETLNNKRGFNLVGNPYPSYLNWELAHKASTNVRSTIWYRTKGTSVMEFHTYNAALGVSVPTSASGYIPPMQAFWVKVDTDPVSPATVSNGMLNFTNAMRGHANSSENRLKAPAASTLPLLRIALSNGSTSDETVIALHENASANFDQYDSEKMSNTGTSEVFTLAGTQELTINAQPDSEGSKLIPLGIRPVSAGSLNLSVSELKNLDNMQIILHDNVLKTETQLSLNQSYHFTTDGTATNNRFSIEFRAPGMTTDLDNSDFTDFNITVYSGKIQIQSPAMANGELIRVYSSNGQKIMEQTAEGNNTIIDHKLRSGVYFVKVSNYVQKIIIH